MQEMQADVGSIPGSGRSPGGGHGNPLQYSCLENPMDRGVWWTIVHRLPKSQTGLKPLRKWQTVVFSIGGGTETMAVCQTTQTGHRDSSATSECVDELAGFKPQPGALNTNSALKTDKFPCCPKDTDQDYIFTMRHENCLKNDIWLDPPLWGL